MPQQESEATLTRKDLARLTFSLAGEASFWDELYRKPTDFHEVHFVLQQDAAAELVTSRLSPGARVLDLGCGAGVLSEKLVGAGHVVDAVDMSHDMLELAGHRLAAFPTGSYRLIEAECESLPFADGTYDAVCCIGLFGYLDDVPRALAEVRRVLRPGGVLVLSVRNPKNKRVFDLSNWVLAPIKFPARFLRRLIRTRKAPPRPASPRRTIELFDQPAHVSSMLLEHGFTPQRFIGVGYGPLTFWGKQLVSKSGAMTGSLAIQRAFRRLGIEPWTRWFADISIYEFEKTS